MNNGDPSPASPAATLSADAMKSDSKETGTLPGGVTLLLRGSDRLAGGTTVAAAIPAAGSTPDNTEAPGSFGRLPPSTPWNRPEQLGWIPQALVFSDLVMVAVAALWTFAGEGDWRWIGIGALLAVGCVQALVAWTLVRPADSGKNAQRGGSESALTPRIRVHFVDETPRHRR
jgi:hypothetical protein